MCELTQSYVTEKRVGDWLCTRLSDIEDAEARVDLRAKAKALEQYAAELREQTNRTVTYENATTLNLIAQTPLNKLKVRATKNGKISFTFLPTAFATRRCR